MPEITARSPMLHVIGLQRSGTNFINKLIETNINTEVTPTGDRTVCWKHSLPWEKGAAHSNTKLDAASAIRARPEVKVILVSKHPFTWWESISRRSSQDLLLKRKDCRSPTGGADLYKCCALYNLYYGSWMQLVDHKQVWHVQYEQSLRDSDQFIDEIAKKLNLRRKGTLIIPTRVPYTRGFDEKRRSSYINVQVELSANEQNAIREFIDAPVLDLLGYDMPKAMVNCNRLNSL